MRNFNERLNQLFLLAIILVLIIMLFSSLSAFIPGMLGTITLYILSRNSYFGLIYRRKWNKSWTAALYLLFYLIVLGVPFYLIIVLLGPRINEFASSPQRYLEMGRKVIDQIQEKYNYDLLSQNTLNKVVEKISNLIPQLVNSTTNLLFNLALMLFLLFYLLLNGREIETYFRRIVPLKEKNIALLATGTKNNIKANALGIPLISLIQGLIASLGYYIFNVPEYGLWGLLTGLFAFFPMVGTMIIWVPIVIFMYANGTTWPATGLLLYSLLITGNVDTLARLTLLKKIGNVHPVVTLIGVISGLSLFGFIGLVFGPLLISYIVILFRIYLNEYTDNEAS
jgi:predicted PurR-regulated permease PerM